MRINETNDQPTYINDEYLLTEVGHFKRFDQEILNIISEHVKDLYTPINLLHKILELITYKTPFVKFSLNEIKSYCDIDTNNKIDIAIKDNIITSNYMLYVLYCNPVKDLLKLNWSVANQIFEDYTITPDCPAKNYYNSKCAIIILNSKRISRSAEYEFELELDHELNHIFKRIRQEEDIENINKNLANEIKQYLLNNNILDKNYFKGSDFDIHMFSNIEFYEMTANVCNVLSLYFNETNDIKLFNKFDNMLTENYLKSNEFKQLPETVKGAIIFAFICKKYDNNRWLYVLSCIRGQLNLKGLIGSVKYYANEILKCFNKLINKER